MKNRDSTLSWLSAASGKRRWEWTPWASAFAVRVRKGSRIFVRQFIGGPGWVTTQVCPACRGGRRAPGTAPMPAARRPRRRFLIWSVGPSCGIIEKYPKQKSSSRPSTIMTTAIQQPAPPAIEYPDDDGEPMADNTLQYKWMVLIEGGLEALFRHDPGVFVAGNLLWYPVEGDPTIRAAPDALVALGRPKGRRGSYKQWEEGNIAPQVVFETLSPGNRPLELADKFRFYEKYGAQEYYIYDPDDGTLEGWIRAGDHLQEVPEMSGFVSPRLGIRFEPGEGADNLTIIGPDGEPFKTGLEQIDQRKAAEQRAETAEQRAQTAEKRAQTAEQRARPPNSAPRPPTNAPRPPTSAAAERQRTLEADQRAERLAARLRELGIEPD